VANRVKCFSSRQFLRKSHTQTDVLDLFQVTLFRFYSPNFIAFMAKQKLGYTFLVYSVILFFFASSVSASARVAPLLQSYGNPIFGSNFHSVYDTSMYGVFQLSNGLAKTPQMGFDSRFLQINLLFLVE